MYLKELNSKLSQERPRRMWLDDIKSWTGLDSYEKIKNRGNDKKSLRACSITCQPSDTEEDIADDDDERWKCRLCRVTGNIV